LNSLQINIININQNIISLISSIYNLTYIKISKKIPFKAKDFNAKDFILIKPLKYELKAKEYEIKATKDKLLPKLSLQIQGYRAFAKAFNTNNEIAKNFGSISLNLIFNFSKKNLALVEKAKISSNITALKIKAMLKNLKNDLEKINRSIKQTKNAIYLQKKSILLKKDLLKSAKVAFKLNRMSIDEYLKYEDDLALSKAKYSLLISTLNSLITQKALIYGKNFKKVFK
jgi:outer membrane protein TolC